MSDTVSTLRKVLKVASVLSLVFLLFITIREGYEEDSQVQIRGGYDSLVELFEENEDDSLVQIREGYEDDSVEKLKLFYWFLAILAILYFAILIFYKCKGSAGKVDEVEDE